jgi:hypothetical protein
MITNVHIHWDPMQTDVKLVQTVMLMGEVEKFSERFLREHGASSGKHNQRHHGSGGKHSLPMLICGDFNSLPGSLVYEFLSNPGGVYDFGTHEDLAAAFHPQQQQQQSVEEQQQAADSLAAVNLAGSRPASSGAINDGDAPLSASSSAATPASNNTAAVSSSSTTSSKPGTPQPPSEQQNSATDSSTASSVVNPPRLKRWKNWRESGYGDIARANVLKHALSGALRSAYSGIDGVPVENQNVFIPPANHLSAAVSSLPPQRRPCSYPVPALPFTNHTAQFTGVIDYIWYSAGDFDIEAVLGGYFETSDGGLGKDVLRWIQEGQLTQPGQGTLHSAATSTFLPPAAQAIHSHSSSSSSLIGSGSTAIDRSAVFTDSLLLSQSTAVGGTGSSSLGISPVGGRINNASSPFARGSIGGGSGAHAGMNSSKVWSVRGTRTLGFPNPVFPSDHIPVMCELAWK